MYAVLFDGILLQLDLFYKYFDLLFYIFLHLHFFETAVSLLFSLSL